MRIALFSEVYRPMVSGVSLTLQRLAAAMTARGHQVRVYAPAYPAGGGEPPDHTVYAAPSRPFFLYPDVHWAFPRAGHLRADFAHFRPDLVHVATEFAMGQAGVRLARQHEVPIVASAHTDYERYASGYGLDWAMPLGWRYLRQFYAHADVVLAPSRVYQDHLRRRGVWHTDIWSRGVTRNMVPVSDARARFRAELGLAPDTPLVLSVGRLAVEKNLHLLVEAWRGIVARRPEARLVLVGDGPLRAPLAAAAHAGIILAGVRTGVALQAAYAAADCFAFPSSTETFGNVLLEAMAAGLPSLAVTAGGVLDFAVHGGNAWLVTPDDAGACEAGLETLLGDEALRGRLSAGARATAAERSWDAVFDRLERDYLSVARRRQRPVAA